METYVITGDILERLGEMSRRISVIEEVMGKADEQLYDLSAPLVSDIKRAVCRKFKSNRMYGDSRDREALIPRQVAMYLCRKLTMLSFPAIGRHFGRHHTSVIHSVGKIKSDMTVDRQLKQIVESIEAELRA